MRFFVRLEDRLRLGKVFGKLHQLSDGSFVSNEMSKYESTLEIIKSAMNGNLDVDKDFSHHLAYEMKSKWHREIDKNKDVYIIPDSMFDGVEDIRGQNLVAESQLPLSFVQDALECFIEASSLKSLVLELYSLRKDICLKYSIDIVQTFVSSLQDNKESVDLLHEVTKSEEHISELLVFIVQAYNARNNYYIEELHQDGTALLSLGELILQIGIQEGLV